MKTKQHHAGYLWPLHLPFKLVCVSGMATI